MDAVTLARSQFAITTVYHFLFVPITIGLAMVVAGFETAYLATKNPQMLRMTKSLGKLVTINFALGLVTGIVQQSQQLVVAGDPGTAEPTSGAGAD